MICMMSKDGFTAYITGVRDGMSETFALCCPPLHFSRKGHENGVCKRVQGHDCVMSSRKRPDKAVDASRVGNALTGGLVLGSCTVQRHRKRGIYWLQVSHRSSVSTEDGWYKRQPVMKGKAIFKGFGRLCRRSDWPRFQNIAQVIDSIPVFSEVQICLRRQFGESKASHTRRFDQSWF